MTTRSTFDLLREADDWTARLDAMRAEADADSQQTRRSIREDIARSREQRKKHRSLQGTSSQPMSPLMSPELNRHSSSDDEDADPLAKRGAALRQLNGAGSKDPPLSLAHFMGARRDVNGPVLNRARPQAQEVEGMEIDSKPVATFLSRRPELLGDAGGRVALPGMVRAPVRAATTSSAVEPPKPVSLPTPVPAPLKSHTDPLPAIAPIESTPEPQPVIEPPRRSPVTSSAPFSRPAPSSSTIASPPLTSSPKIGQSWVPKSAPAPAFLESSFAPKAPTASLTRLAGSSIVAQRVQQSREREQAGSGGSAPSTPPMRTTPTLGGPAKRTSVMDRWTPQSGSPKVDASPKLPSAPSTNESHSALASAIARGPPASREVDSPASAPAVVDEDPNLAGQTASNLYHPTASRARGPRRSTERTAAPAPQPTPARSLDTLRESWDTQGPIAAKTASPAQSSQPASPRAPPSSRVALPGMVPKPAPTPSEPSMSRLIGSDQDMFSRPIQPSASRPTEPERPTAMQLARELDVHPSSAREQGTVKGASKIWGTMASRQAPLPPSVSPTLPPSSPVEPAPGRRSRSATVSKSEQPARSRSKSVSRSADAVAQDPIGHLPSIDLRPFAASLPSFAISGRTVSVDVHRLTPTSAEMIPSRDAHIFYDTETLAIVHRSKDGGLVSTAVLLWRGPQADESDAITRQAQKLASQYSTALVSVLPGREPVGLAALLGGTLITRAGSRDHFDAGNTTLTRVRAIESAVFIDQVTFEPAAVCSGFAYVISILGNLVVWFGRGSSPVEQSAALGYAKSIASGRSVQESREGTSSSKTFWRFLNESEPSASASHWRYRSALPSEPIVVAVGEELKPERVETPPSTRISVVDTGADVFVLVPPPCRAQRRTIAYALDLAEQRSKAARSSGRPFRPPVHALILPSATPLDLAAALRGSELDAMNGATRPARINLLTLAESRAQLARSSVPLSELADPHFLPLGHAPA